MSMTKNVCTLILFTMLLCISVEASMKQDETNTTQQECVYGRKDANFGRVFGLSIAEGLIIAIMYIGCFAIGFLLHYLFPMTGFIIPISVASVFANKITIALWTWKWYGPGDAYERGKTGNLFQLSLHIVRSAFVKITIIVIGGVLVQVGLVDQDGDLIGQIRVILGALIGLGLNAYSLFYSFEFGIPSYFIGSDGNSFNDGDCSGPEAWADQSGTVRYTEVSYYVGIVFIALFAAARLIYGRLHPHRDRNAVDSSKLIKFLLAVEVAWEISLVVVSSIVIHNETNDYHRATAIYDVIFSSFATFSKIGGLLAPNKSQAVDISADHLHMPPIPKNDEEDV